MDVLAHYLWCASVNLVVDLFRLNVRDMAGDSRGGKDDKDSQKSSREDSNGNQKDGKPPYRYDMLQAAKSVNTSNCVNAISFKSAGLRFSKKFAVLRWY